MKAVRIISLLAAIILLLGFFLPFSTKMTGNNISVFGFLTEGGITPKGRLLYILWLLPVISVSEILSYFTFGKISLTAQGLKVIPFLVLTVLFFLGFSELDTVPTFLEIIKALKYLNIGGHFILFGSLILLITVFFNRQKMEFIRAGNEV